MCHNCLQSAGLIWNILLQGSWVMMWMWMTNRRNRTSHPTCLEVMSQRGKKTRRQTCLRKTLRHLKLNVFLFWRKRSGCILSKTLHWWIYWSVGAAVQSHDMLLWFCAYSGSKATSPDSRMKEGRQPLAAPFGTDNGTPWEREADGVPQDREKVNGAN